MVIVKRSSPTNPAGSPTEVTPSSSGKPLTSTPVATAATTVRSAFQVRSRYPTSISVRCTNPLRMTGQTRRIVSGNGSATSQAMSARSCVNASPTATSTSRRTPSIATMAAMVRHREIPKSEPPSTATRT